MKNTFGFLLALVSSIACAEHYGAPITLQRPVSLEAAIKQLDGRSAADVLVESKVSKVCQVKGCWIGLVSASGDIHVTFKDEAFVVPLTLMGKTVVAQGELTKVVMTLDETRAQVKANGGDPSAVKRPGVRYELVASGLEVKN